MASLSSIGLYDITDKDMAVMQRVISVLIELATTAAKSEGVFQCQEGTNPPQELQTELQNTLDRGGVPMITSLLCLQRRAAYTYVRLT
jgi:hypothetical protein